MTRVRFSAVRVMGGLTAGYGMFELLRPEVFARQVGILGSAPSTRLLTATLGIRDLLSGATMLAGPRRLAVAARCGFDLGDVVAFTVALPREAPRAKVAAIAAGWAGLNALAYAVDRRRTFGIS